MSRSDFKEYTRIRDIVVKRNKRAAEAGLAPLIHFPTVKEIKSGAVRKNEAMTALQEYYTGGTQVKQLRKSGKVPEFRSFEFKPLDRDDMDDKRKKNRLYRRYKKALGSAATKEIRDRYMHYLKALEGLNRKWSEAGLDLGISLEQLTPKQAQAFVEYMEYRYSQGDFTGLYMIDEFVQQFSELLQNGYKAEEIVNDFNIFLEDRDRLEMNYLSMEGITAKEANQLWKKFVRR